MKTMSLMLGILFLASGCTHTVNMRGFDQGDSRSTPFRNKKVAIVVVPGKIHDNYSTSTDVYTYEFKNVEPAVTEALKQRISSGAQKVDVISSEKLSAQPDYDFYLYPEVNSRSVHDFWTMGCLVKYRLEIRDRSRSVVAEASGEGKRNFYSAHQADEKCKVAMAEVFSKVTDKALSSIR